MKTSPFRISCITAVLGLALGLLIESSLHNSRLSKHSESIPRETKYRDPAYGDAKTDEKTKPIIKTKSLDRNTDRNIKGPRVSIPLQEMEQLIKRDLGLVEFNRLKEKMEKILPLIGAAVAEKDQLISVIQKAESEIFAAEKNHIKIGELTENSIQLDRRAMREPVEKITSQIKNEIRSTLNTEMAETLISNMDWKEYYNIDERPFIEMKVTRNQSGELTASIKNFSFFEYSYNLNAAEFKDDGNPLPAERVFDCPVLFKGRWKPSLEGMFILPKDE